MSHNLKRLLIAVYICLVCLLAIATFLEQACGTDFVEKYIYHTFWFCCLWGILAAMASSIFVFTNMVSGKMRLSSS